MQAEFAYSNDGTRIAFDVSGEGPAIILLHGGWRDRKEWHQAGYVDRLKDQFKLITMDIRGNGESDKPDAPSSYSTEALCQDILAVADACAVERFTLWGYSYGGNVGRYLATRSDRVERFILVGIPFGPAAANGFREFIEEFWAHWHPILQARADGTLNLESLAEDDKTYLAESDVAVEIAWLSAMLDWQAVEPDDLLCPTLWLSGSENKDTVADMGKRGDSLSTSFVQTHIIEGLNHRQEFTEVNRVLPVISSFINGDGKPSLK